MMTTIYTRRYTQWSPLRIAVVTRFLFWRVRRRVTKTATNNRASQIIKKTMMMRKGDEGGSRWRRVQGRGESDQCDRSHTHTHTFIYRRALKAPSLISRLWWSPRVEEWKEDRHDQIERERASGRQKKLPSIRCNRLPQRWYLSMAILFVAGIFTSDSEGTIKRNKISIGGTEKRWSIAGISRLMKTERARERERVRKQRSSCFTRWRKKE